MWGVRPRFSWMTSTPPRGVSAVASNPISSPFGPAKRISSPPAVPPGTVVVDSAAVVAAGRVSSTRS